MYDFDLLCIGSGPAGQRAAVQAAKLGCRVAVVEKRHIVGGICVDTGTIPSKTFREAVIFFAGLPWKLIVPPVVIGAVAITLIVSFESRLCAEGVDWRVLHDYQKQRVCTLLDPSKDPLGKGFHIIQGMIAIGSGGVGGKGFMQGTQTHLEFIPERTTDFIFAAYSEEFGLVGNLALIAAFILLIFRGLAIAASATSLFSRLLAGAVTMIFFTYAFVNMGMVSGILPVVGVPLPFISYGGTAMVTLGLGLGILMSISKSRRFMRR